IEKFHLGKEGIEAFRCAGKIPFASLEMAAECLREKKIIPQQWSFLEEGDAHFAIDYDREADAHMTLNHCVLKKENQIWELAGGPWTGKFVCEEGQIKVLQSRFLWGGAHVEFKGALSPAIPIALSVEQMELILRWPEQALYARFLGQGKLQKGLFDFELLAQEIDWKSRPLQNNSPIRLSYSSLSGCLVKGIDLQTEGGFCKIGLVQFDPSRSLWTLNHSQIRIPSDLFSLEKQSLEFLADFEWASDFSYGTGKVKEGFFPILGAVRHIRDLKMAMKGQELQADFQWIHEGRALPVEVGMKWEEKISGSVVLYDEELPRPFRIEGGLDLEGHLFLTRIEGSFEGIEASFSKEEEGSLIGSARLDFSQLQSLLPESITRKMSSFQIGAGLEIMGRLKLQKGIPSFEGMLSGKEVELFQYRFKTLLAQLFCSPERVEICDFKLSDSAGILQIPKFLAVKKEHWNIDMPQLSVFELRPSLLQKIKEPLPPMSPLVIRELNLYNFRGRLDQPSGYTATGELSFINSYRRMHTVYDLPADVLGLLVGLDQEILIPAFGHLRFELNNGQIRLTELTDTFSQGKRSQFFLVMDEHSPYIDLEGQLHILIKMKQFVLFKFTEFFLISIEGSLNDPEFHLQKKKGFFGL
ncbi:MAG: hypothetical protein HY069_02030, partial [Chlamydiia bacterium]|nr:hypothetical protein [Chlamydiia bacterium]